MRMIVLLALLIGGPTGCYAQTASSPMTSGAGSSSTITIAATPPTKTCTVHYRMGQIQTNNCDFSLPLMKPRFFPADKDEIRIEFDQIAVSGSTSNILVNPIGRY